MKKFLSLVLALVMTMSLVTISAGAKDFTDGDKVTYNEAIDVMSALKVIDGYTDGSFKPTTQLNRGQAAKILCNMILGPTTASALKADAAPFKDVAADNTFAGYIAYCAKAGIIDGYTDGTFRPSAPLTGYAFMKLLLGALGYDKDVEGYNTPNWSINVAKQALGIGLDAGLLNDFDGTKIVTREEACLYAFNTLKATMVQYDAKTSISVGGAEVVIAGSKAEDVKNEIKADNTIKPDGKMQFAEKYFSKLTATGVKNDVFGRPAVEWKYKNDIIGTYADVSTLVASYTKKVTKADMYDLVGASIVKDFGDKYELEAYLNGKGGEVKQDDVDNYFAKNDSAASGVADDGVFTEVYMNEDNKVTIVQYYVYLVKATADYNSTKEILTIETLDIGSKVPTLPNKIENDDFDVEDFKENDYILVTYADDAIQSVEKAELKTGNVTEWTEDSNVYLDGEKYSYNAVASDVKSSATYAVKEDAVVVLDTNGYIMYVDQAVSNNNYLYIRKVEFNSALNKSVIADAYFVDGTSEEIIVKKVGSTTVTDPSDVDEGWYNFSKASDGKYTLMTANYGAKVEGTVDDTNDGETIIKNAQVTFMNGFTDAAGKGLKANASTLFILRDYDGTVTTYTGISNAPTVKVPSTADDNDFVKVGYITNKAGTYATKVFIDVAKKDVEITDVTNIADYLFLLKSTTNYTYVDGSEYRQYKVLFDGEETTKYIESTIEIGVGELGYNVKANDKGYITSLTKFEESGKKETVTLTTAGKSTISKSEKVLTIAGEDFIVNDETVINLIIGKGCGLLKDPSASYELYLNTTASALAGLVKDYYLKGEAFLTVKDTGSEDMDMLYVYIESVEAKPEEVATYDLKITDNADKDLNGGYVKVTVDGKTVVTKPSTIKLTAGEHSFVIEDAGKASDPFKKVTCTVTVTKDGKAELKVPAFYKMAITGSLPSGGKLTVDGVDYSSASNIWIPAGEYAWEITGTGVKATSGTVKVEKAGDALTLPTYYKVTNSEAAGAKYGLRVKTDYEYVAKNDTVTITVSGTVTENTVKLMAGAATVYTWSDCKGAAVNNEEFSVKVTAAVGISLANT